MKKNQIARRIIISCKTNIGDVIVTLPMAGLLKKHWPGCKIILLARNYVKDLIPCCVDIDEFLSIDDLLNAEEEAAIQLLKSVHADCFIHVTHDKKIARWVKKADIAMRVGTVRRWYHFLYCNRIVWTSRRSHHKHEAQLNVRMLSPLNIPQHYSGEQLIHHIRVSPKTSAPEALLEKLATDRFNLVIHPGTNGHTKEWPITHFQQLIATLPKEQFNLFLTGAAKELEQFKATLIEPFPHIHNLMGKMTLAELAGFLAACDGILVGSTGPAHLTAALGNRTLALYPAQVGRNPRRWRPLGVRAHYLVAPGICPLCAKTPKIITDNIPGCTCMAALPVAKVKQVLDNWRDEKIAAGAGQTHLNFC